MLYIFLFIISLLNLATAKVLYITPSTSDLCTTQCLTISELAANTSNYISSNTTLVFTAGTHHLTVDLTVSDVNNVSITSTGSHSATVYMQLSYINLNHSQSIHISNMDFFGYGGIKVSSVEEFVLQNAVFDGQDETETSLSLFESTAKIINCSYISNIKDMVYGERMQRDGLVVVIDSNISFSQCNVDNNEVMISSYYYHNSVLLVINSWVTIDSSTFVNNTGAIASNWGNTNQARGHIDISNSYFYGNSAEGVIKSSGGSLNVTNSTFIGNTGRDLDRVTSGGVFTLDHSDVFACNNSFDNNNANDGGVMNSRGGSVMLETCSFDSNHGVWGGGALYAYESNITVKDCNFTHNTASKGAVIDATNTLLTMNSSVVIANNVATQYATVYLDKGEVNIWGIV